MLWLSGKSSVKCHKIEIETLRLTDIWNAATTASATFGVQWPIRSFLTRRSILVALFISLLQIGFLIISKLQSQLFIRNKHDNCTRYHATHSCGKSTKKSSIAKTHHIRDLLISRTQICWCRDHSHCLKYLKRLHQRNTDKSCCKGAHRVQPFAILFHLKVTQKQYLALHTQVVILRLY